MLAFVAMPAQAQVVGALSVASDYRVRGGSISGRRPAATLDLSYDDPTGLYLSGTAVAGPGQYDGVVLLGVAGTIGYARRIGDRFSLDGGVSYIEFPHLGGGRQHGGYGELYVGASGHGITSHLSFSPAYFDRRVHTLYGDVDMSIATIEKFRLAAHAGLLAYLGNPGAASSRLAEYDWRATVSRRFGILDIHASISSGGPRPDRYDGTTHGKTAATLGATLTF